jgi:hypothetical protein
VAEIPEQDFYFVDITNLLSGWPNERSDVSPVRFRYGKLLLIRAACAVRENLIKSLLRDCWSADRKRHAGPRIYRRKTCHLLAVADFSVTPTCGSWGHLHTRIRAAILSSEIPKPRPGTGQCKDQLL